MLTGEALWRVGIHCLNRTEANSIARLHTSGMDALLAKDAAFFHENFAGSLTKRVLSFAAQYENFVDALMFRVVGQFLPLGFASVVLWRYDPLLVAVLLGMIVMTALLVTPLIRRRQALVDAREAAWARLSGHVADTMANMDAVRAHASERREAAEHRHRVSELRGLTLRAWDYHNLRIDTLVAPLSIATSVAGLLLALGAASGSGGLGVEAVVVTVAYFGQATQILFQFNQTYRQLERSLTEAAFCHPLWPRCGDAAVAASGSMASRAVGVERAPDRPDTTHAARRSLKSPRVRRVAAGRRVVVRVSVVVAGADHWPVAPGSVGRGGAAAGRPRWRFPRPGVVRGPGREGRGGSARPG